MPTTLTATGITHDNGQTQTHIEGIVKVCVTSSDGVNHSSGSGFGNQWQYVSNTEINMGVPAKANNWYRIRWQTICDDQGGGAQGTGAAIYRWTPSAGWNRVMDQGHHATLENDTGDLYWMCRVDYLIPVHPSFPTQEHRFRIYHANWNGPARINCAIGDDLRRNGWNNNILEIFELDTSVVNSGNLTRY
jgi:hypothetical protein